MINVGPVMMDSLSHSQQQETNKIHLFQKYISISHSIILSEIKELVGMLRSDAFENPTRALYLSE